MSQWWRSAALALCLGAAGCGSASRGAAQADRATPAAAPLPSIELTADAEKDSDSYPGEVDNDNNHVFGRRASASETRVAVTSVRRYYAAAARGDGAAACALIYTPFAEAIPAHFGQNGGLGQTCASVMAGQFAQQERQLRAQSAALRVAEVRVLLDRTSVRLSFGGRRAGYYMELHRERGTWMIDRLFAIEQAIYVE